MMKMNLIAGFACIALLTACSSQRVVSGDGAPGIPSASEQVSTEASTSTQSTTPAKTNKPESSGFIQVDK